MRPTDLDWPCNNVMPGMAPVAAVLARTEETVVAVTGIRAYPTGFGFTLTLRLRNLPALEQPMLSSGPGTGLVGSGSSPDRWGWDMDYRARPLPPPGPLAFVCVWPERGIPPSRVEIDGAAVLRAAEAAVRLWSDDPYCSAD